MSGIDAEIGHPAGAATRRLVVVAAAVAAAVAAWAALVAMVAGVPAAARTALGPLMGAFGGADLPPGLAAALAVLCLPAGGPFEGAAGFAVAAGMWFAMTVAMMLPPALPGIAAAAGGRGGGAYAAGHLFVWAATALVGVVAQGIVQHFGALTPLFAPASGAFAGTVLVAAGLYQFTPAKDFCLARSRRPPVGTVPRAGAPAALVRGAVAALDGLGCCLGLMAAMFAVGLMNLAWLAILTLVFAVEKATDGHAVPRAIGAGLMLWGAAVIAASPVGLVVRAALLGG